MTTTPALNGQAIGQAERATRAVLDRLLADSGTTFHQWVALNVLADGGSALEEQGVVERMVIGLKIDASLARVALEELEELGLTTRLAPARVRTTAAGDDRFRHIRGGIDRITERLYGDVPVDDLATAGRVLALVTERANAELAGADRA